MDNEKVLAEGSRYELVKHQVGDRYKYEVRHRASAPAHRFRCHAVITWDIETNKAVVRDTFMGVIPLEDYEDVLSYKKDLLETAKYFNETVHTKVKVTDHPYYCDSQNSEDYESWGDFTDNDAHKSDEDYNLLFRYDILDEEDEYFPESRYVLHLFYVQQRKGTIFEDRVHNIKSKDMETINEFLRARQSYLKKLWV